jgi:hypothetical protein
MAGDAELVKAGIDAALAPVKDFANRLFGPALDELGGILADPIRICRFKRSVRLLEKTKHICDETGYEPKAVPLKMLLPILESASLEDDEYLHDQRANLLANAAMFDGRVHRRHDCVGVDLGAHQQSHSINVASHHWAADDTGRDRLAPLETCTRKLGRSASVDAGFMDGTVGHHPLCTGRNAR